MRVRWFCPKLCGASASLCRSPGTIELEYQLSGFPIVLNAERFRCIEPLFNRRMIPGEKALQDIIFESISACDKDVQPELWSNIVLSGGNTLFQGFEERLRKELQDLTPP